MSNLEQSRFQPDETTFIKSSLKHSNTSRQLDYVNGVLSYALPGNKSEAGPGTCIFFDTETHYDPATQYQTGQYQRLRLGCAIAGRIEAGRFTRVKTCNFSTAEEFWSFVYQQSDSKRPIWLFAHNIGFDLTIVKFPELLHAGEFRVYNPTEDKPQFDRLNQKYTRTKGFLCVENPPVIISCNHISGWKLICVDTFNYFVTSLSKLGDMVGLPKLDMPPPEAPDNEWYTYCMRDVEVTQRVILGLTSWVKDNNLGKFRFTAPSQAMAAFRHRWNKPAIKCHDNVPLRQFERQAYYGGRLECFYIGELTETLYELDVTSLYPSVMAGNLYPTKLLDFSFATKKKALRPCIIDIATVASVKLKTNVGFPRREKYLGTIYPVGEYWTTLAGPELVKAKELGLIQETGAWSRYQLAPIFDGFVDFFWQYRLQQLNLGNTMNADLAKLLMNGLYGKFGQLTNAWVDRPDITSSGNPGIYIDETFKNEYGYTFRNMGQCVQQFCGKTEHPYAFPAIAAYVTSYAREWMRMLKLVAGERNVYYMVTDALFVNAIGKRNLEYSGLIADKQLGMLRIKHTAEYGRFDALHHYQVGEHQVNGSRKKSARPNPDGSFTELQFESFERILLRQPDGSVHVKPITKRYSKEYKRGTKQLDGWVKPLLILE